MSHTPGNWFVDATRGLSLRVLADDERETIICAVSGAMSNPVAIADARLIAAAPDLYEALNGMVGLCALLLVNHLPVHVREALESSHHVIAAREALAKAEA